MQINEIHFSACDGFFSWQKSPPGTGFVGKPVLKFVECTSHYTWFSTQETCLRAKAYLCISLVQAVFSVYLLYMGYFYCLIGLKQICDRILENQPSCRAWNNLSWTWHCFKQRMLLTWILLIIYVCIVYSIHHWVKFHAAFWS